MRLSFFDLSLSVPRVFGVAASANLGVLAYKSVAQAIPATTDTRLTYDLEVYDGSDWHDNVTNNARFTVPAGVTLARFHSGVEDTSTQSLITQWLNGSGGTRGLGKARGTTGGNQGNNVTSALIEVTAGQYFETAIFANSTGDVNTNGSNYAAAEIGDATIDRALVGKTANQSISGNTNTLISWNTESYDTNAFHDNATNNTRLTAPATGYYNIGCNIDSGSSTTSQLFVEIFLNGATASISGFGGRDTEVTGVKRANFWTGPVSMTAAQYAEVNVFANTAFTLTNTAHSWFAIEEIPAGNAVCKVRNTADQTIGAATHAAIAFGAELFDTAGFHDNATNNSRITIPAGYSRAKFSFMVIGSATADQKVITLKKNGVAVPNTTFIGATRYDSSTSGFDQCSGSSPWLEVVAGDYFEVDGYSDGAWDVLGGTSGNYSHFSIEAIA